MPRRRYRQDPLPLGAVAPAAELFGPEQASPPGLQLAEQGQLAVVPLGPLFDAVPGIQTTTEDDLRPLQRDVLEDRLIKGALPNRHGRSPEGSSGNGGVT
ncbi:hypothetical protein KQ313_11410 [Synechococcus sp. CS-1325]|uniref:hypothetical protein n=1 Tax=unclassified Synechococcus TaxID=2626047 RepID=UPI000DB1DA00|nr:MULTISPECIES: hypothetical protein [unclassified Synechococcus]MCT0200287.1 hypothetical protein [Synechococcus sp. CS-1325]MCT0214299.1 hypothetical protein [Synechococcus sp. CS-1326]MCT0234463.1 hypothetical protein [Synechococcus sp. CS-1327]PZV01585.1 MAG: hypothetical protein DCF24_03850 [Cyanobium sp.]